jgi:hypothetical protein
MRDSSEMHRFNQTVTDGTHQRKSLLHFSSTALHGRGGRGMTDTVFTFETTHHALWAEEVAREAGIPAQVVPAPPAARARCNLALETLPDEVEALAAALAGADVPHARWSPPADGS